MPTRQDLWDFINEPDNIVRMETATYLNRPAVEPLSPNLLRRFGQAVRDRQIKQLIGRLVRKVLEPRGYRIDRQNVKIIRNNNIFKSGTRYI